MAQIRPGFDTIFLVTLQLSPPDARRLRKRPYCRKGDSIVVDSAMRCHICGFENSEGVRFCGYCGKELPLPNTGYIPQTQEQIREPALPQHAHEGPGAYSKILVAVVVVIVLIAVIVALVVAFAGSGPHLKISNWTSTNASVLVIFTVEVANTGHESGSATIHCTVTFGNGDTYRSTQEISLGAGESGTYAITVIVPFSHILDTSGQYSCTLS